jgi:hypothetical protein
MKFKMFDKVLYRMKSEPTILRGTVIGQTSVNGLGSIVSVRWDIPLERGGHKVCVSDMRVTSIERTRALQPIKYLKQFNMGDVH